MRDFFAKMVFLPGLLIVNALRLDKGQDYVEALKRAFYAGMAFWVLILAIAVTVFCV